MTSLRPEKPESNMRFITQLSEIPADSWNRLATDATPFMRHEFLAGLERHISLDQHGWYPQHLIITNNDTPVAAMPLYLKTNSWGEFVFDWSWADAYERAGGHYYPKLVNAVPFTPVCGPRLLCAEVLEQRQQAQRMIQAIRDYLQEKSLSSFHSLFPLQQELESLEAEGLLLREDCQYHWQNPGYRDFQDFLDTLSSKKRKRIRKERREIAACGIEFEVLNGHQISEQVWHQAYEFYCSTFHHKGNTPRLSLAFFIHLGREMPDQTLLFVARDGKNIIAMAFAMCDEHTLYGRHWGCNLPLRHLHFELCYYQTIEYCIARGLREFNAGAQGEHKVGRGFSPVKTGSAHYLADQGFAQAVKDFLRRERQAVGQYVEGLAQHSAYRQSERQE